jgi:ribonuclease VapC
VSRPTAWVLDSSALLAFLQGEPGADLVAESLTQGSWISAVNWAETLSKLQELGEDPDAVALRLENYGILGTALLVIPLEEATARAIARLRPSTRDLGLSLGDRACLALTQQAGATALTADRAWNRLELGIDIRLIR